MPGFKCLSDTRTCRLWLFDRFDVPWSCFFIIYSLHNPVTAPSMPLTQFLLLPSHSSSILWEGGAPGTPQASCFIQCHLLICFLLWNILSQFCDALFQFPLFCSDKYLVTSLCHTGPFPYRRPHSFTSLLTQYVIWQYRVGVEDLAKGLVNDSCLAFKNLSLLLERLCCCPYCILNQLFFFLEWGRASWCLCVSQRITCGI